MRLELVDRRTDLPVPDPWAGAREQWPRLEALAQLTGPADWKVDLVLVDDEAMAGLNTRWRGDDGTTDVLSFSYLEREGSGTADLAAGDAESACDLWLAAEGAGDAGVIRPYADDTAMGLWGPPGVVIANLKIPHRLRVDENSPVVATTK